MSDVVVDSSVVAKWFLPEDDSLTAARLLREVEGRGGRLIVLDLALVEVAQAIWKRRHRRLMSPEEADRLTGILVRAPLVVEPSLPLLLRGAEIARAYDRSVYDALFVALAEALDLPGITADEPLRNAVGGDMPRIVLLRDWP